MKKILILGASGMLGYSIFNYLTNSREYCVYGTVRDQKTRSILQQRTGSNQIALVDLDDQNMLEQALRDLCPDIIINCIGVIKQSSGLNNTSNVIRVNSLFPHIVAELATTIDAQLIHFSTDCVYDGISGNYHENDLPSTNDLYGRSKLLGEVTYKNHLTIRTSIIGHGINRNSSLVDWFLSQTGNINGYRKAFFTGMPTVSVARVLSKYIFGSDLTGLIHLGGPLIDKHTLLLMVGEIYQSELKIKPSDTVVIDRSLNFQKLMTATGYVPATWPEMLEDMHKEFMTYYYSSIRDNHI